MSLPAYSVRAPSTAFRRSSVAYIRTFQQKPLLFNSPFTCYQSKRGSMLSGCNEEKDEAQSILWRQSVSMYASGAVLGPLCDGQHSLHNVLHYTQPQLFSVPALSFSLETCWWVPLLFGGAAVILGVGNTFLDDKVGSMLKEEREEGVSRPSWGAVLIGIALFVTQYSASGALEQPLLGVQVFGLPALDGILCVSALLFWRVADGTKQGLFMAALTGTAGFWTEIGLINGLGLYHYTHPQFMGVPSWIPWVYFCGSPAVGNLGRRVRVVLTEQCNKRVSL